MYDRIPSNVDPRDPGHPFESDARNYGIPNVGTSPFDVPVDRREYPDDRAVLSALEEQQVLERRMAADVALGSRAVGASRETGRPQLTERERRLSTRLYY